MNLNEKFSPHMNLKKVYSTYFLFVILFSLILTSALVWSALVLYPSVAYYAMAALYAPIVVLILFFAYWMPRYYSSIKYMLTDNEVIEERGVWWKSKHVVPYSRVMSIDVIQGPISRRFEVGSLYIYTAGYTGPHGGAFGRKSEASIIFVSNPTELRNQILEFVNKRPLFSAPVQTKEVSRV
ncbi:MAG: PH domain-containing protein [Candidatus Hadarchaeota archaeon]